IPSIRVSRRTDQFVSSGRSIGGRVSRGLLHFSVAALIGAGATFAWSHGDDAKEMVRIWIPSTGRLLSVSTTKRPADVVAEKRGSRAAEEGVWPNLAPPAAQEPVSPATSTPPEETQELESASERDLAALQPSEERLSPKQEETAKNIATPQPEQDSKQEMPSP